MYNKIDEIEILIVLKNENLINLEKIKRNFIEGDFRVGWSDRFIIEEGVCK